MAISSETMDGIKGLAFLAGAGALAWFFFGGSTGAPAHKQLSARAIASIRLCRDSSADLARLPEDRASAYTVAQKAATDCQAASLDSFGSECADFVNSHMLMAEADRDAIDDPIPSKVARARQMDDVAAGARCAPVGA